MPDAASDPTLGVALQYAALGLRVLPIKPGTKRPPMKEWVESATADPGIITNWYTGMYADHGTGLAMGQQPNGQFVFALDADEHDVAHSGVETLADLQAEYGHLPDTWCSITGSGGLHLLFTAPPGVEIRNTVAGDALDVRGEGGQIVVFPSVHPVTGRRYEWEHGYAPWERPIAEAPAWLIDRIKIAPTPGATAAPVATPASVHPFENPDSPAEWLRSWWNWPVELRKAGWTEHHAARNGDIFWTRPGKDRRDGESAVLHMPDGPFVVWSTDASLLGLHHIGRVNADGSVSVSGFEFYAWTDHHGDMKAAARFLASKMPGSSPDADRRLADPASSDDENPLARYIAQKLDWPSFWTGEHAGEGWVAEPLIPAGRLTVMYAPAKQGKSEITLAVVAALATGKPILGQRNDAGPIDVVYLDYEMTEADLSERLGQLGYSDKDDMSHLHYWSLPSLPPMDTPEGAIVARGLAAECNAQAFVIDTMGRAVEGDENSNDTYRAFARTTGLGLKSDGVAVVRTDHAGKDKEKGQRGASAKNDDADVVFRVDRTDNGWKLTRTHTRIGWVPDTVAIDRTELSDGRLRIELASSTVLYPVGTGELVKDLRAAGVTVAADTTVKQLEKLARGVGLGRGTKLIAGALKFMKAELTGPTPVASSADSRLATDAQESPGDSPASECQEGPITASNGNVEAENEPNLDDVR